MFTYRKYFQLACLESGQWEEAACEAVSCPALPDVFQGMYTCTNSLFYDTRCTLRCQDQAENVGINFEGGVLLPSQRVRNLQLGFEPAVLFHAGVRLSSLTDSCCFSPLVLKLPVILFFPQVRFQFSSHAVVAELECF